MAQASASSALPGLTRRVNDIRTFQIPRLQNCRGPLSLHAELADELRQDLEDVARNLDVEQEVVEVMALDLGENEAREMRERVDQLKEEHKRCTLSYRSALMHSKRAIKSAKGAQSRYELDTARLGETGSASTADAPANGAGPTGTEATRFAGADDEVQTRTNEVTDALKRTTQVMQAELERSVLSVRMLETSTETLRSTSTLYSTYTSLLTSSSQIVKALERADWQDRILISAALLFFLLVVGWILKRRVFDKVVGGVGWWVGGSRKLLRMGLGGGRSAGQVAETSLEGVVEVVKDGDNLPLRTVTYEGTVVTLSAIATRRGHTYTDTATAASSVSQGVTGMAQAIADAARETVAAAQRQHVEL